MSDSRKKVILRRHQGPPLFGYLPGTGFVHNGDVALLDLEGHTTAVPLASIQTIFFVRDFNRTDHFNPERLSRRSFVSRPRGEGLWVRLTFRNTSSDNPLPGVLEGLAPLDISLLDSLVEDGGIHLIPPDTRANTLRLFVPRAALADFRILAVIGGPKQRPAPTPSPASTPSAAQESLFSDKPATPPPTQRRLTS